MQPDPAKPAHATAVSKLIRKPSQQASHQTIHLCRVTRSAGPRGAAPHPQRKPQTSLPQMTGGARDRSENTYVKPFPGAQAQHHIQPSQSSNLETSVPRVERQPHYTVAPGEGSKS
ncbi:hypothetical protein RRG08_011900 [Elysia crispata]|uniref:Uncharacterized protein n=1 Tax=Elysia crispata TaxID=231223 RepID=A0AAE0ZP14_9GAST|nr:hypothetical protein RRG08_011900 [Elysia crispata]